jgi:hypothetical protein
MARQLARRNPASLRDEYYRAASREAPLSRNFAFRSQVPFAQSGASFAANCFAANSFVQRSASNSRRHSAQRFQIPLDRTPGYVESFVVNGILEWQRRRFKPSGRLVFVRERRSHEYRKASS